MFQYKGIFLSDLFISGNSPIPLQSLTRSIHALQRTSLLRSSTPPYILTVSDILHYAHGHILSRDKTIRRDRRHLRAEHTPLRQ